MHIEPLDGRVNVTFEPGDPPEVRQKTIQALGYCCAENSGVEVAGDVVSAPIASNASAAGAVMLVENIASTHQVEGDPAPVEQTRDELIMSDGLPFVMNH